jgi:hypothetical protein
MIVACENAKSVLRRAAIDPSERKTLNITLSAAVAAAYLDRTPEGLAKAEARGRLPAPKVASNGRRFYTVADMIAIARRWAFARARPMTNARSSSRSRTSRAGSASQPPPSIWPITSACAAIACWWSIAIRRPRCRSCSTSTLRN